MSVKDVEILFKKGLELMKAGHYAKAEAFFVKAKELTLELQQRKQD